MREHNKLAKQWSCIFESAENKHNNVITNTVMSFCHVLGVF